MKNARPTNEPSADMQSQFIPLTRREQRLLKGLLIGSADRDANNKLLRGVAE